MGIDISGICQIKKDEKWITIPENPDSFQSDRDRYFYDYLIGKMHILDLSDPAIDDLMDQFDYINCREDFIAAGGFTNPGYFTLTEFIDLKYAGHVYQKMVRQLKKICGTRNHDDFRIVIVFDV